MNHEQDIMKCPKCGEVARFGPYVDKYICYNPLCQWASNHGHLGHMLQILPCEDFDPTWNLGYAKPGDVGMDLYVAEEVVIPAGGFRNISTGIRIKLPEGFWAAIESRSSTFAKRNLISMRGIIDNGYTGKLYAVIYNPNPYDVKVDRGERLAQLVMYPVVRANIVTVSELPDTERGQSGFGSTGGFGVSNKDGVTGDDSGSK